MNPRAPALLVCYSHGDLAHQFSMLSPEERLDRAVSLLDQVFPRASAHFECGSSVCWNGTRGLGGGWPLVEGFRESLGAFRGPQGSLFFAGDYTPDGRHFNTMEGAIGSGLRPARQIEGSH